MPNPGDFDPAKAINFDQDKARQRARQQQAEKQRAQAQEDLRPANILKLLRYADEQLENIRNPVVSEFVVTERWWMQEKISDRRGKEAFKRTLRPDQRLVGTAVPGFFSNKRSHFVTTRHEREQARYYGSWLSLSNTYGDDTSINGLVKLRQPRAGYAYVHI